MLSYNRNKRENLYVKPRNNIDRCEIFKKSKRSGKTFDIKLSALWTNYKISNVFQIYFKYNQIFLYELLIQLFFK